MKKNLVIFLFFISVLSSNAQDFQFGVIAEPCISWFKTDISKIKGDGSMVGINVGLLADRYFAEHYAFSTGLSLHMMGGIIQYNNGLTELKVLPTSDGDNTLAPNSRVKYNLQYLHIPLSLKFKTSEIGYATFFAKLGVDAMINVKARATLEDGTGASFSKVNVNKEINLFNFGYHIGAGVEYKIVGNTAIIAGITYMNGIADITNDDTGNNSTERALLHCLSLSLGVVF